jgi:hypothetical protein
MVQPGMPQVHAAIPVAPVTANGVTNQMSVSAPMVVPGAAGVAPGGGGPGATTVIPSQMMPTTFPANFSNFLDPRDATAPVVPRRSRRSQRHRHRTRDRHDNRRRSSSQSSGSSGSGTESPYSEYDSGEYSRHHHYGHNPLPRPPKDILSSTPFRPILTQLPSAQYNSWGIGGTHNMPQPQPQPQPHQPTTYSNIRPRRTRRGLFNSRQRDQYPVSSLGAAANHMGPTFIPPAMSMPEAQYAPPQQPGPPPAAGGMTPVHGPPVIPTNSPMIPMPNPDPAPPPPQGGPVIPPGMMMSSPAPAGSTPYIGANLGTPRTRGAQTPGPGPQMHMAMSPSSSSDSGQGHMPMPMPTPMGGVGGTMPMPSPAVGTPGLGHAQMAMAPPGSVLVNAAMTMPSPSLGAGGGGNMAQVLKFNGYGEFSGLLYHSPHSVVYEEELYPTALHLFEAQKFLDHRPDLAERIRQCEHVEDVTAISAELADFTRRDWGNVALTTVSSHLFFVFYIAPARVLGQLMLIAMCGCLLA